MKSNEAILQSECFKYTWNNYIESRRMFFHIPNGGYRNILEGSKFKAMGVIAGVPDMCLILKGKVIFFEFKTETGKLSDEQIKWHEKARNLGYEIYVVKDFKYFKSIIDKVFNSNT